MEPYLPRRRRQGETRYVQEILTRFYPGAITISPVRLGTLPEPLAGEEWTPEERAMLTTRQRWADAVAIEDRTIHLIEGKLLPGRYPEGLSKLEVYRTLVPNTPSLVAYAGYRLECELWTPIEDPVIKRLAAEKGIRNAIFEPAWFKDFLTSWFPRSRRSPRYT